MIYSLVYKEGRVFKMGKMKFAVQANTKKFQSTIQAGNTRLPLMNQKI
jgi:hypothetical protein